MEINGFQLFIDQLGSYNDCVYMVKKQAYVFFSPQKHTHIAMNARSSVS